MAWRRVYIGIAHQRLLLAVVASTVAVTLLTFTFLFYQPNLPPCGANDIPPLPAAKSVHQRTASHTRTVRSSSSSGTSISKGNLSNPSPCQRPWRFSPAPLPVTALASVQGSGNSWVRYLLQQLTGIYTGSLYSQRGDPELWAQGFFGEGVRNGSVIAVKTHGKPRDKLFKRAIVIIRNPFDAIFADFNRRVTGSHTGIAPPHAFVEYWNDFCKTFADRWKQFHLAWVKFPGAVLLVNFSTLMRSLHGQVQEMAHFLKHPSLSMNISCALTDPRGGVKRTAELTFDKEHVFTRKQIEYVNKHIQVVQRALKKRFPGVAQAMSAWKWTRNQTKKVAWRPLPRFVNS